MSKLNQVCLIRETYKICRVGVLRDQGWEALMYMYSSQQTSQITLTLIKIKFSLFTSSWSMSPEVKEKNTID